MDGAQFYRFLGRLRWGWKLLLFPVEVGAGYGVHLCSDLVEEALAVGADSIEIEVGAVGNVGEVGIGVEGFEAGFEFVGRAVEVEGVCRADEEVDAAFQASPSLGPGGLDDVGEVVVVVPVGNDLRMDCAGLVVEHLGGSSRIAFR